ncbi:lysosome-associated membrane glycoprotein 1-like [Penaeus monodon]|uniref:lysosome-associated membrane glycoprotein 1-like n=1 Tax=Penaeus monodon TaxID=6687 RepID=UPI0018A71F65|nr:lysosome-associated membrane glycoprotein 1-like [Penaeus monodon]
MARLSFFSLALLLVLGTLAASQDISIPDVEKALVEDGNKTDTTPAPPPTTPAPTTAKSTTTPETTTTPNPTTTTPNPTTTTPEPTTTTPKPTTTTPEPTTTTPEPTTTTPEPTTTTPEPTTTTPEPVTTSAPETNFNYNVTENNVTCVMVQGTISFTVNYTTKTNKTAVVTVTVPEHGGTVTGTCNGTEGEQYIEITWGAVNETSSTRMTFNRTKDSWSLIDFTATVFMGKNFVNSTIYGEKLDLAMNYNFSPLEIGVNRSFNCHSHLSAFNVTGTLDGAEYELPLGSDLTNIQIQAYNEIVGEKDFVDSVHCTADNTSDVVPIAVGCALAGLVVIVLIAYLVGRRRRSAAYQSV